MKTHLETSPDDAVAVHLLHATTNDRNYATLWLSNFDQPTSDTDSSDDDFYDDGHGKNETNELAEKIKMYTHCLLDLSATLECPAPDAAQVDHAVAQPQHDLLPNTEKADATLHSSADLTKWWDDSLQSPWKIDDLLSPWLDADFIEPTNFDSVLGFGSYTESNPWQVPTSTTFTKPTSDTKPERSFPCAFRKVQSKLGLPYTCTGAPVATVSAVRTHLTRNLPKGTPPHLPFLKLCTKCNEDVLDNVEFETRHGVDGMKCETPHPQRKGTTGQQEQYDLLCSKVEAYIAAQEAQKGI